MKVLKDYSGRTYIYILKVHNTYTKHTQNIFHFVIDNNDELRLHLGQLDTVCEIIVRNFTRNVKCR